MPIPRVVHQIWLQGAAPPDVEEALARTRRWCLQQGLLHRRWAEPDLVAALGLGADATYAAYPLLHQRVDYCKVLIMTRIGGVYLDADVSPLLLPLSSAVDFQGDRLHLTEANPVYRLLQRLAYSSLPGKLVNNGVFASPPEHPALLAYLARMRAVPDVGAGIENTTGPNTLSYFIESWGPDPTVLLLPWWLFEACCFGLRLPHSDSVALHRHRVSWFGPTERAVFRLAPALLLAGIALAAAAPRRLLAAFVAPSALLLLAERCGGCAECKRP